MRRICGKLIFSLALARNDPPALGRKDPGSDQREPVILRAERRVAVSAMESRDRGLERGGGSAAPIAWLSVPGGKRCDLGLKVVEVVGVGGLFMHLLKDGREVMQGAHGLEGLRFRRAEEAPAGGEGEGGLDEG